MTWDCEGIRRGVWVEIVVLDWRRGELGGVRERGLTIYVIYSQTYGHDRIIPFFLGVFFFVHVKIGESTGIQQALVTSRILARFLVSFGSFLFFVIVYRWCYHGVRASDSSGRARLSLESW